MDNFRKRIFAFDKFFIDWNRNIIQSNFISSSIWNRFDSRIFQIPHSNFTVKENSVRFTPLEQYIPRERSTIFFNYWRSNGVIFIIPPQHIYTQHYKYRLGYKSHYAGFIAEFNVVSKTLGLPVNATPRNFHLVFRILHIYVYI